MRQNGRGQLTIEEARTWLEETGLCLFLPRRQYSSFVAPSFVEAVAGERNAAPPAKLVSLAEELLVRLEAEGVAVRLNLLGQPGEQPDYIVATWVLPYVYALRGDRDWRRSPQLTGSRQVSPLAIQTYKLLEAGDATIPQLKHTLGREVTESAVLRAITELWQQLRIIPAVSAAGKPALWQLLRLRFQKAIAEGASTSQVTAISVLASIYLQAVIAASMEEVELFLAPLTARSKVREVLRGLLATRQVHTISLGHAPHFYVAGTLPEFAAPPTIYASSSMPASTYFLRSYEHDEEVRAQTPAPVKSLVPPPLALHKPVESPAPVSVTAPKPAAIEKPAAVKPHFNHQPVNHQAINHQPSRSHSRKPGQSSTGHRDIRGSASRSNGTARRGSSAHWAPGAAKNGHSKRNGSQAGKDSSNGNRFHANGNGHASTPSNGNGHASRTANGSKGVRSAKPGASRNLRNGRVSAGKSSAGSASRPVARRPAASRKDVRAEKRVAARGNRKPALAATAKAGSRARYGFTAAARKRSKNRG
jgi:hypothetical protein